MDPEQKDNVAEAKTEEQKEAAAEQKLYKDEVTGEMVSKK